MSAPNKVLSVCIVFLKPVKNEQHRLKITIRTNHENELTAAIKVKALSMRIKQHNKVFKKATKWLNMRIKKQKQASLMYLFPVEHHTE